MNELLFQFDLRISGVNVVSLCFGELGVMSSVGQWYPLSPLGSHLNQVTSKLRAVPSPAVISPVIEKISLLYFIDVTWSLVATSPQFASCV